MTVSWDKIQDALAAAIRGDELRPVVSQRTLFGIPSSVEVQMARLTAEMERERAVSRAADSAGGGDCKAEPSRERALRGSVLAQADKLGDSALIGRGMRYFIHAGREAGFDIPAYPFDPKGEFKDFLRERGARNLPEYYASLGIPAERYEQVQTHALLVLRDAEGGECGFLLKGAEYCDPSRVLPLAESGFVQACDALVLESLAALLDAGIS